MVSYYYQSVFSKYGWENAPEILKKSSTYLLYCAEEGNIKAILSLAKSYVSTDAKKAFKYYKIAANHNVKEAKSFLAMAYDWGIGIPQSIEEAAHYYEELAKEGNSNASNRLGLLYEFKLLKERSLELAFEYYAGNTYFGLLQRGRFYSLGYVQEPSDYLALSSYNCAAEILGDKFTDRFPLLFSSIEPSKDIKEIQTTISGKLSEYETLLTPSHEVSNREFIDGTSESDQFRGLQYWDLYTQKKQSTDKIDELACLYCKTAVKYGLVNAHVQLGKIYKYGSGAPLDLEKGLFHLNLAAEYGKAEALFELGDSYEKGIGVPISYEKAYFNYLSAAQQGHPPSLRALGLLYLSGKGIKESLETAFFLLHIASELGDAQASLKTAELFEISGEDIKGFLALAAIYYQKSADLGNVIAQYRLGRMYELGLGVAPNTNTAFHYFQLAANQGSIEGCVAIAYYYAKGIATEISEQKALHYYNLAARQTAVEALEDDGSYSSIYPNLTQKAQNLRIFVQAIKDIIFNIEKFLNPQLFDGVSQFIPALKGSKAFIKYNDTDQIRLDNPQRFVEITYIKEENWKKAMDELLKYRLSNYLNEVAPNIFENRYRKLNTLMNVDTYFEALQEAMKVMFKNRKYTPDSLKDQLLEIFPSTENLERTPLVEFMILKTIQSKILPNIFKLQSPEVSPSKWIYDETFHSLFIKQIVEELVEFSKTGAIL